MKYIITSVHVIVLNSIANRKWTFPNTEACEWVMRHLNAYLPDSRHGRFILSLSSLRKVLKVISLAPSQYHDRQIFSGRFIRAQCAEHRAAADINSTTIYIVAIYKHLTLFDWMHVPPILLRKWIRYWSTSVIFMFYFL